MYCRSEWSLTSEACIARVRVKARVRVRVWLEYGEAFEVALIRCSDLVVVSQYASDSS